MAFFQFIDPSDHEELVLDSGASLNHVALSSTTAKQVELRAALDASGISHRTVDHGYCVSLYMSDPDGLTVEFTADAADVAKINAWQRDVAHSELDRWLGGDHTPNNHARESAATAASAD